MISKIKDHQLQKTAYVYLRQSTMSQVLHNRESTERQYALRGKAEELGWASSAIRVLDGDLGVSGAHTTGREDFKMLLSNVALGKVGAVLSLEASRLARSSAEWHRLIEICALTSTLVIDEDGIYDPEDFNDALLLGMKGTMAQAELHFMRARLLGGKINKAKKGELHFPLPVGLSYDDTGRTVIDADKEVAALVRLVFETFKQTGSAYAVVKGFAKKRLRFPKRAYGGAWNGKLIWAPLSHARVLGILKNPTYAGTYVYGRHQSHKTISTCGEITSQSSAVPMDSWKVIIHDHHEAYITWAEYLSNQEKLQANRTNGKETLLSGPAREGLALLQGLCICGECGRKLTNRYQGNGGIYPIYECNWLRHQRGETRGCMTVRCELLDEAISKRILEVLESANLEIAIKAVSELERRDTAVCRQWQMRVERTDYEAQLAQRRYEEVDPSNRLVASTLEHRWNEALLKLEDEKRQFNEFRNTETKIASQEEKNRVLELAKDLPKLWNEPTTSGKDKKRMLRLLIKDITVKRQDEPKQATLQIRWQGGACETIVVVLPRMIYDRYRNSDEIIDRVRILAVSETDSQIVSKFNSEGLTSAKGKNFTIDMIRWIRHKHQILRPQLKTPDELTVKQVATRFEVTPNVVYYWIERGVIKARRENKGSPYRIKLSKADEIELKSWIKNSKRINVERN